MINPEKLVNLMRLNLYRLFDYHITLMNLGKARIMKPMKGGNVMAKYACSICGYVYDEAEGAPEEGIAPGTKWEEVPDDWVCPLCGAGKSEFEKQE
jgi:rubredoxin